MSDWLLAVDDKVYTMRKAKAENGDFILDFKHMKTHKVLDSKDYVVNVGQLLPVLHTDYVILEPLQT